MLEQLGPLAYGFALLLFRTLGLVTSAPLLSLKGAPQTLRLGLAAGTAFAIFTGVGAPQAALPPHLGVLIAQVFAETALGVVTGLTITFALEAAGAAGQLASQSMGLGYAAVLDPLGGNESTIVGQLLKLAALGAALGWGSIEKSSSGSRARCTPCRPAPWRGCAIWPRASRCRRCTVSG